MSTQKGIWTHPQYTTWGMPIGKSPTFNQFDAPTMFLIIILAFVNRTPFFSFTYYSRCTEMTVLGTTAELCPERTRSEYLTENVPYATDAYDAIGKRGVIHKTVSTKYRIAVR